MFSKFEDNLMYALLAYRIINIYTTDNDKIVIGDGGIDKNTIFLRPFGFYIKDHNSAKWYSYFSIKRIEVFGHEF